MDHHLAAGVGGGNDPLSHWELLERTPFSPNGEITITDQPKKKARFCFKKPSPELWLGGLRMGMVLFFLLLVSKREGGNSRGICGKEKLNVDSTSTR